MPQGPGLPPGNFGPGGFPPGPPGGAPQPPGSGPGRQRPKWLVPAIAGAAALVLVLTLTGGVVLLAGEVPRGTTVLGVDIGGRSRAEAATALRDGLGKRVDDPVPVRIGDANATIKPRDVGLAIDHAATAERAVQSWPNPFTVLFGEREVDPVVKVDVGKLDDVLQKLGASATEKLARPAIRYKGLTPKPIYPESGKGLDPERSAQALRDEWLRGGPVAVPIVPIEAMTTKEDVDKLLTELAQPAVAAPVVVSTPRGDFTITRQAIAKSLIMESDRRGQITPKVDTKKLRAAAGAELARVELPAKDAKPAIRGGKLVISQEATGQAMDLRKLAKVLLPALRQAAPRKVPGDLATKKPKLTRERISKLGIKERISSFTTYFQGGQDRNKNILVIADEVDNALVLPGKAFSLNGYTGERSYAQGYVDAPVILNGEIKNHVGGGISQFATTLFNASYYAGMVDVYHQPHGYYISRYPSVIEATVFYPSLDLKFKNDSRYGVVIDTSYTDTSITVSMWSTKRYDIKTKWGPKTNPTDPKTVHLNDKECIPTEGIPGFSQEAWRLFYVAGKEIRRERFSWRYKAEPKFICDPPPSPTP
jgi:vancomycin resistance protein YoaR